ncbi:MAG: UbiX family flavin prenyltransferase [Acidobacteria bacterium]|nr:UbiX family flavin prenyltransferase [Acidobacteriota bacterium]
MRLIVGMTGSSGTIYGIRMLQVLKSTPDVETHLIISEAARISLGLETAYSVKDVEALADAVYSEKNIAAPFSSGSYKTEGMVIVPCSIKTLSAVANCYSDTLLTRAADVVIKERRKLVLVVRETPLHAGHLKLMHEASLQGAIIMPPIPAFYHKPKTIEDLIDHTVGRILDVWGIEHQLFKRWGE